MVATGFSDTFNRTVSGGLGTATSGQAYILFGTASQFSVTPSVATISPTTSGEKFGYLDLFTSDVDITGQVALTAIPSTNLTTVGFVTKLSSTNNYYVGSMMVATGGAVSLRFSKVVSGGLVTIATVSTGLTYVANTFYNLRVSIRWSQALQTNVMQSKLWAIGATQPGGWQAVAFDSSFTQYTAGSGIGIHTRDESTVVGSVAAKIQNVSVLSYNLPMPASTDPMCYDPAITYPKQSVLKSIADAADAAMTTLDPTISLAGLFPRVKVSVSSLSMPTNVVSMAIPFAATEFNVNTPTNLAYDSLNVYLPTGIWAVSGEIQMAQAASDWMWLTLSAVGSSIPGMTVTMRTNPAQTSDPGVGGCGHISQLVISSDSTTPVKCSLGVNFNNVATTYTCVYAALTAVKISDYFA